MSLFIKAGTFSTGSGATGRKIDVNGLGWDPRKIPTVVLVWGAPNSADGFLTNYHYSFGWMDGVAPHWAAAEGSQDNVATSQTIKGIHNNHVWIISKVDNTGSDLSLEWSAWNPDGFKLNVANDSAIYNNTQMFYVAIGGKTAAGVQIKAGFWTANTVAGDQDVTDPGFLPDLVMVAWNHRTISGTGTDAVLSFGMTDGTNQWAIGNSMSNAAASGAVMHAKLYQRTDSVIAGVATGGTEEARAHDPGRANWPSTGFRITWDTAPSSSATFCAYVAIKGICARVGSFTKTTGVNDTQDVVVPFLVKGAITVTGGRPSSTSIQADAEISFGASDGTTEAAFWAAQKDATINTVAARSSISTKSVRNATLVAAGTAPSAADAEADFSIPATSTARWTWSSNDSTLAEILYCIFGDVPPLV